MIWWHQRRRESFSPPSQEWQAAESSVAIYIWYNEEWSVTRVFYDDDNGIRSESWKPHLTVKKRPTDRLNGPTGRQVAYVVYTVATVCYRLGTNVTGVEVLFCEKFLFNLKRNYWSGKIESFIFGDTWLKMSGKFLFKLLFLFVLLLVLYMSSPWKCFEALL